MSVEVLSTIFAGLTFVVIGATAIAAIVQLRHLRASNQLSALLTLLKSWQDPQFHGWMDFVINDLVEKMKDPVFVASLEAIPPERRIHPELHICDFYEQVGSYMKYGLLDEKSFLDVGWRVTRSWSLLWPVIEIMRRSRKTPALYENFEYLAARGRLWEKRHPGGNYPKGTPRMREIDPQYAEPRFPAPAAK